jgi:hypothetical protein
VAAQPKLSTTTSVRTSEYRHTSAAVYGATVKFGTISPAWKFTVEAGGTGPHG